MYCIRKIKNNFKNRKGSTLVELLVYIAIVAVVIGSLLSFGISIFSYRNKSFAAQEVQANLRVALRETARLIRSASSTNVSLSTFGSNPGVLSLAMSETVKNPTVISLTGDQILQVQEGTQSAKTITSKDVKITKLIFTDLTGDSDIENIKIEMTIAYNNPSNDINYNYSEDIETAISLRR